MSRQRLSSAIQEVETSCETMRLVEEEIARLQASLRQMREDVAVSLNDRFGPAMAGDLMQMVKEGLSSQDEPGPEATAAAMEVIAAGMQGLRRRLEKSGHVEATTDVSVPAVQPVAPAVSTAPLPSSPDAVEPALPARAGQDEATGPATGADTEIQVETPKVTPQPSAVSRPPASTGSSAVAPQGQAKVAADPARETAKPARKPKRRTVVFGINVASRPQDKVEEMISQAEVDAASRTFDQAVLGLKGKNHWRMVLYKAAHEHFTSQLPSRNDIAAEPDDSLAGTEGAESQARAVAVDADDSRGEAASIPDDGRIPDQEIVPVDLTPEIPREDVEDALRPFAPITEDRVDQSGEWDPEFDVSDNAVPEDAVPEDAVPDGNAPAAVAAPFANEGDLPSPAPAAVPRPSLSPRTDERRPTLGSSLSAEAARASPDAERPPPRRPSFLQNQLGGRPVPPIPTPSVAKDEDDWDDPYGDRKAAVATVKPAAGPIPVNGPSQRERPPNVRPNLGIPLRLPVNFKLPPNVG